MATGTADEYAGTGPGDIADPTGTIGNGGDFSGTPIDPGSLGTGTDDGSDYARNADGSVKRNKDGSPQRKRGRRAGGSNGTASASATRKAASALNLNGVEAVLLSLHGMAAVTFSVPELALEKEEAAQLTAAFAEVAKHYPMTIDPKLLSWFNLVFCMAMLYGPRMYLVRNRKASEKKAEDTDNGAFASFTGGKNLVAVS